MNAWRALLCGAIAVLGAGSAGAGTIYQVKDINSAGDGLQFKPMAELDGRVIFWGYDGVNGSAGQPWISDGTTGGTQQIAAIVSGGTGVSPLPWTSSNGRVYFVVNDGFTGDELWSTDGTGTPTGTARLTDIAPGGGGSSHIRESRKSVGGVFFVGASVGGGNPDRVWKSDGTIAGTGQALTGFQTNYLDDQESVDGLLAFFGGTTFGGSTLFLTDGTDVGTTAYSGTFNSPGRPLAVNDAIFFSASSTAEGNELWHATTSVAAATLVKDIVASTGESNPQLLRRADDLVFFTANSPGNGRELWVSDGTGPNTNQLLDIFPGVGESSINMLGSINGILYFGANDGTHGQELWRSDGTTTGTHMVKDIAPGSAGSMFTYAPGFVANHELFFVATDTGGTTLWMSDGTDSGTRMVDPTKPSVDSNTTFQAANGRLFLTADSGAGRELHAVDLLPLLGTKWCKNAEQPLHDAGSITSRFRLPSGATVSSLNASVDLGHTWMGDLVITLTHTDSSKTATLLDRPGFPATPNGCSGKLLDVLFTDGASVSAETSCGALARPAYPRDSSVRPTSALSTFAGDNLGGEWVLTVTDAAAQDTGTLHDWCLYFNDTIFADGFD